MPQQINVNAAGAQAGVPRQRPRHHAQRREQRGDGQCGADLIGSGQERQPWC